MVPIDHHSVIAAFGILLGVMILCVALSDVMRNHDEDD